MKRPKPKAFLWITLFLWMPFMFALAARSSMLSLPSTQDYLQGRFLGGLCLSIPVWAFYGVLYAVGRKGG